MSLTFADLRAANERLNPTGRWDATTWWLEMAATVQRVGILFRQQLGGETISLGEMRNELADLIIGTDALAAQLNIPLDAPTQVRFDALAASRGSPVRIRRDPASESDEAPGASFFSGPPAASASSEDFSGPRHSGGA